MNLDDTIVESFGAKWKMFYQNGLSADECSSIFDEYLSICPLDKIPADSEELDMGCSSGRWARLGSPRVGKLNCIHLAPEEIDVAKKNLRDRKRIEFHHATTGNHSIADRSQGTYEEPSASDVIW